VSSCGKLGKAGESWDRKREKGRKGNSLVKALVRKRATGHRNERGSKKTGTGDGNSGNGG